MIYSVLGWIYETLLCSIEQRKFINRGFLNGPYCPIYGCGAIVDILFLHEIENTVFLFFAGVLLTCSLEYLTSWVMEKLFRARWWDYSDRKFNINGRVCLLGAVVFGTFSVVLIKFIHPFIFSYTSKIPFSTLHFLSFSLFVVFSADCVHTITNFAGFAHKLQELNGYIDNAVKTANRYKAAIIDRINESEIYEKISMAYESFGKKINNQERRMLLSFPKLKSTRYDKILQELKENIKKIKGVDKK